MKKILNLFLKEKKNKKIIEKEDKVLDLTGIPLIDRKDFDALVKENVFKEFTQQAKDINKNGYCKLLIKNKRWLKLIDEIKKELENLEEIKGINEEKREPIRFQDAWLEKKITKVKELAIEPYILNCLKILYGREPFPFQTLNFPHGSRQHFHSDAVHFNSIPRGYMCGIWIALEDIKEESGPLYYFPKSHKLPFISAKDLGLSSRQVYNQKHPQKLFEPYWIKMVQEKGYLRERFIAKKGEVLIWHSNLLHGGDKVINNSLTRWSQVTHYYFKNCGYFTPLLSTTDSKNNLHWRNPHNLLEN